MEVHHNRADNDPWTGGTQDDLVAAGFTEDDTNCYITVSKRIRVKKKDNKFVVYGKERHAHS